MIGSATRNSKENVTLILSIFHLMYIPSKENEADTTSRRLTTLDCKLHPKLWQSTTRVSWSKGTHVWLDGTWFERNDRPGWFSCITFDPPPVATVLWCQFLCARSIKWSSVSGVSLSFSASLSDGYCSAFSKISRVVVHGHSLERLSEKVLMASYPKLCH